MPEHSTIANADCHEPKHVTDALTSDAGKVVTPSSTTAGTSELRQLTRDELSDYVEHYGQQTISGNTTTIAVTAAVDATLGTATDYMQVTGIFDAIPGGLNNGVTQQTNQLTVAQTGVYRIEIYANTSASTASTVVGFRFAVNGTVGVSRQPKNLMKTAGDVQNGAAHGFISLTANDVLTLWIASDTTSNITIEDAVFQLTLIRAL